MLEGVFIVQGKWQLPAAGGRQQSSSAAVAAFAWGQHLGVCSFLLCVAADPSGMKRAEFPRAAQATGAFCFMP